MTSPIRVVPLDESFAITGIADYDVEIHVRYRTPDDATETHNYFASIDGMPGYEARGATELGAAEAICGRLIADLTKPPEFPGDPSGAAAVLEVGARPRSGARPRREVVRAPRGPDGHDSALAPTGRIAWKPFAARKSLIAGQNRPPASIAADLAPACPAAALAEQARP